MIVETKSKPTGKKPDPLTPDEQKRRFDELCEEPGTDQGETLDKVLGKIVPPNTRGDSATSVILRFDGIR